MYARKIITRRGVFLYWNTGEIFLCLLCVVCGLVAREGGREGGGEGDDFFCFLKKKIEGGFGLVGAVVCV